MIAQLFHPGRITLRCSPAKRCGPRRQQCRPLTFLWCQQRPDRFVRCYRLDSTWLRETPVGSVGQCAASVARPELLAVRVQEPQLWQHANQKYHPDCQYHCNIQHKNFRKPMTYASLETKKYQHDREYFLVIKK